MPWAHFASPSVYLVAHHLFTRMSRLPVSVVAGEQDSISGTSLDGMSLDVAGCLEYN